MATMDEYVDDIEKKLGVPPNFFINLRHTDPWSYVIKLCAFFQATLATTISEKLGNANIAEEISHLPFAESHYGQIKLAIKLGILQKEHEAVLIALANIRNRLAHNISMTGFSWESYLLTMDHKDRRQLYRAMQKLAEITKVFEMPKFEIEFSNNTQGTIHLLTIWILYSIITERERIRNENRIKSLSIAVAESLVK